MGVIFDKGKFKPIGTPTLNAASRFAYDSIILPLNDQNCTPIGYAVSSIAADAVPDSAASTPKIASSFGMHCFRIDNNPGYYLSIAPDARIQTSAFTVLIAFRVYNFSAVCTLLETNFGVSSSTNGLQLRVETNGTIGVIKDNVSVIMTSSTSNEVVKQDKVNVVALSYDNSTCSVALNGFDITASVSAVSVTHGQYALGAKTNNSSSEITRPLDLFLFGRWPRIMSISDLISLSSDPGQLFATHRNTYLAGARIATTTVRPQIIITT